MTCLIAKNVSAADVFPVFKTGPIEVVIPTNTPHLLAYSLSEKEGTNLIYRSTGQIFTNAAEGHIQSKAEGFSGSTDRSTPWKVITELLAVNQEGNPEAKTRALFSSGSQKSLDEIYNKTEIKERFQSMGSSITNMQALMWHQSGEPDGGLFVYTKYFFRSGRSSVLPLYMVKQGEKYELVSKTMSQNLTNNMQNNIMVFLQSANTTRRTISK
ncbi:MAG: hypothetical protein JWM68_1215 [Verrucomicrobiales bacterium]|nr:hypothetical protein [Verrucomicrobiales bacterium]